MQWLIGGGAREGAVRGREGIVLDSEQEDEQHNVEYPVEERVADEELTEFRSVHSDLRGILELSTVRAEGVRRELRRAARGGAAVRDGGRWFEIFRRVFLMFD